ncbi:MAG: D-alanyl-D-alanine carboxypeptidase [Gammaproteobacteria bacterium]|uniref:D-alanyl-D-alanine carboxypeptidase family protein n=1 Tax=Luteimonas sp. JM171 TaxID=1896164 RepID=UPI0008584B1E|nr:D-alanyl-D-alanine carboxypeptidase family protein [Luteimonas sp. JM171]AOH35352.1 serine-type D-Ala-D-Ala carboxypeptidase [Luteimonas sp. JM171]NLC60127.1 D-alanyl-D-alanine carboxypeptidase [Gammaproteobacteria bacterium]
MKFSPSRFVAAAAAALSVATIGLALAQSPQPAPAPAPAPEVATPPPPSITGTAWILMDYETGQVLAGENIDERVEPASITKVMTSYVIASELEAGRISEDDQVMMTENAWRKGGAGTGGSFSGFEVNQTAPLLDMEIGMAVQSGNDAAIALAEHVAGTEEAFASLMNAHAQRLGMTSSHFVNSHGLSEENHYSTARDLAVLGRSIIRDFPDIYAHNKIREFTVGPITQRNRNLLLWRDDAVDGIKTGHHSGAGYCLMASAQRGDQRLISVVMGSTSEAQRANDSMALLNWGFRFFETHRLYDAGEELATQRIWKGRDNELSLGLAEPLLVSTARGKYEQLQPSMDLPATLVAPVEEGQVMGTVRVMLDGEVVAERPLVALQAVERAGFFKRLWHEFLMWWQSE